MRRTNWSAALPVSNGDSPPACAQDGLFRLVLVVQWCGFDRLKVPEFLFDADYHVIVTITTWAYLDLRMPGEPGRYPTCHSQSVDFRTLWIVTRP